MFLGRKVKEPHLIIKINYFDYFSYKKIYNIFISFDELIKNSLMPC